MHKAHNGAIDLLKFLFALMIVAFHFFHFRMGSMDGTSVLFPLGRPLPGGYIGVEFFFVVSGFFMAQTADKRSKDPHAEGLGSESVRFVLHKFLLILPYYLFSVVASVALCKVFLNVALIPPGLQGLDSLWELLLLQMSGLGVPFMINDPVWYLSAMLIAMLLLYPLLRKNADLFIHVVAPLTALFLLGYLSKTYGSLLVNYSDFGLCYPGMLRAVAEICLGCVAFGVCRRLPVLKTPARVALSLTELFCYGLVVYLANITYNSRTDFIMLGLLTVGITLTMSRQSVWVPLFQNRFCYYLGRLSMALFLCHFCINRIFLAGILPLPLKPLFAVYLLCSLALSVVCLLAGDGVKRAFERIRSGARPEGGTGGA